MIHQVLSIVLAVVIVGVLIWALDHLPIDATVKQIARVILIVVLVIWAALILFQMVGTVMPR